MAYIIKKKDYSCGQHLRGEHTLADMHEPYTVLLRRNRRTNAAILKSRLTPSPARM